MAPKAAQARIPGNNGKGWRQLEQAAVEEEAMKLQEQPPPPEIEIARPVLCGWSLVVLPPGTSLPIAAPHSPSPASPPSLSFRAAEGSWARPPTTSTSASAPIRSPRSSSEAVHFPLQDLPPYPPRPSLYWSQPLFAAGFVGAVSAGLVWATMALTAEPTLPCPQIRMALRLLIWVWAWVAVCGTGYIIFAGAGEVRRSADTCFPIPQEVERRLRDAKGCEGMENVKGPDGSKTHGTFCVRCFVWRPPMKDPDTGHFSPCHHCSICQRCVVGFDHHCDFFGRCIVTGNMLPFGAVIAMLWAGLITVAVAFFVWAGASEDLSSHHHRPHSVIHT